MEELHVVAVLHFFDISAGGEGTVTTRDHETTDGWISIERLQGGRHLRQNSCVERVQRRRAVDLNHNDSLVPRYED